MKFILTSVLAFVLCGYPLLTQAQESAPEAVASDSFVSDLIGLNRIKPQQNPKYERARDILDRRILDRRSKVIGNVRDVIVTPEGDVDSLLAVFSRLSLKEEVYIRYGDFAVKGMHDGYMVSMYSENVEDMYPGLLADIETAAGDDSLLSLRRIRGADLVDARGQKLGRITDVLFNTEGRRAVAVYVEVDYGSLRDVGVAVPFYDVAFREKRGELQGALDPAKSAHLVEFAKGL